MVLVYNIHIGKIVCIYATGMYQSLLHMYLLNIIFRFLLLYYFRDSVSCVLGCS